MFHLWKTYGNNLMHVKYIRGKVIKYFYWDKLLRKSRTEILPVGRNYASVRNFAVFFYREDRW